MARKKRKNRRKVYYNEKGVKIDYKLIESGYKYQKKINKQRALKRQEIYPKEYVRNTQLGAYSKTVGENQLMSQTNFEELNDVRFNPDAYTSQKNLEKRVRQLKKMSTKKYQQKQAKNYKQNLLESYKTVFAGKIDNKKLKRLENLTKNIKADDLVNLHYTSDIGDIDYIYGSAKYSQDINELEETFNNQLLLIEQTYNKRYEK